jgi:thioredoxin-like negative regulator of GroEL
MKKILYFTASWCQPCKSFAPIMEQVSRTVKVEKIDVDALPNIASAYNIRSVPTVVILNGNTEVGRFTGARPAQSVLEAVNNA